MGADIHAYIEYDVGRDPPSHYFSFGARIYLQRDYMMFTLLAGVRSYDDLEPVYPVRGLPQNASWEARGDYFLSVVADDQDDELRYSEAVCSMTNAKEWVERGISSWEPDHGPEAKYPTITQPDWHSTSWLTPREYRNVLDTHRQMNLRDLVSYNDIDHSYLATLAALDVLSKSRLVFWFDN